MFECRLGHVSMEERRLNNIPSGQICDRPLRKANTSGSQHITGTVFNAKMCGPIDWIGPHEQQFIIRAAIDPRITRIRYQPVWYEVLDGEGGSFKAFPDFLIEIDGSVEIHEVKSDDEYARPEVRRRLELTEQAAARHGHSYSVTLASALHRESDKHAVNTVWRRVNEPVDAALLFAVDDLLVHGPLPIGEACARLTAHQATIHDFHRMLASGHVVADMKTKPDDTMIVHGRADDVGFDRLIPFTKPIVDRR